MYCSEYFNVFEYLVGTSNETKTLGGILAKSDPKNGKTITTETLHLMKMAISVVPEKKDYVSGSRSEHNQHFWNLQKFLSLARIIYCFQRKTPICKYLVLKVLFLETQMVCSG